LKSDHDAAANNLGILLYRQGKSTEAAKSFKRAIEANPGNKDAVRNLDALENVVRQTPAQ